MFEPQFKFKPPLKFFKFGLRLHSYKDVKIWVCGKNWIPLSGKIRSQVFEKYLATLFIPPFFLKICSIFGFYINCTPPPCILWSLEVSSLSNLPPIPILGRTDLAQLPSTYISDKHFQLVSHPSTLPSYLPIYHYID